MASLRIYKIFGVTASIVACSSVSVTQPTVAAVTTLADAPNTPASPVPAPPDAVFLFESGVVTYDWTLVSSRSAPTTEQGQAWLAFDRWGHRQATAGHPGPKGNMVMIFDEGRQTRYVELSHRAIVTSRQVVADFTPEELRTLQDVLPTSKESRNDPKTVAGIRCKVTSTETRLPTKDIVTHSECVGRGIPLEITDAMSGPNVDGFWLRLVATKLDLGAKGPEEWFKIPADVVIIDMDKRSE